MCEQCALAVEWYYPKLTDEERGELLMSATSFPFGDFAYIEKQLQELTEKTDGTLEGALKFAQQELDREYEKFKTSEHGTQSPNQSPPLPDSVNRI